MTNKHVIYSSPNGYGVYVDLIASSAGRYISRQPYIIGLIKEVLNHVKLSKSRISMVHDMGRVIGGTDIIRTKDSDIIYYAIPHKQNFFARYAKNRHPIPSRKLTMILTKDTHGDYELSDTWIGPFSPPFPGAEGETSSSKAYWQQHALAQDADLIQSRTITKVCPY